jgi:hypothetical protein
MLMFCVTAIGSRAVPRWSCVPGHNPRLVGDQGAAIQGAPHFDPSVGNLIEELDRSPGTATHADETRLRIRHDADTQYREARLADL